MNREFEIINELTIELDFLRKGLIHLQNSFNNCKKIGIKDKYSEPELESWEAFTARYSRLSDISTQKIMNSIMIIETGNAGSLLDKSNFAEKKNWIEKAENFRQLRLLRNYIVHEYSKQDTNEIFEIVLKNYTSLTDFISKIIKYISENPIYKI